MSIWVVQSHPDNEGSSGWAICDHDLRQQHPDGITSPWYQKMDGTKRPLVQGNGWYKSWVGTKIMLVQTHHWYKETVGTK
jgi:hypothetical protein